MGKRKNHKPKNNNDKISKKKRKTQRKNKQKKESKIMFRGINGEKYDKDGNKQEISSDEEDKENNEIFTYVENFFGRIKACNKTIKAKEYLNNFKEDKKNWKFNKSNQIFILKYILYYEVFEDEYFKIFLDYIKNMYKETKEKFIKQCEEYINKYKDINKDEDNMEFTIRNHNLKFINLFNKNTFYSKFNKRCVEIIENN